MKNKNKKYISLFVWIVSMVSIGFVLGLITKDGVDTWYVTLNRSSLTPPNEMFGVVWTVLYAMIGVAGWLIYQSKVSPALQIIKKLYVTQLVLNWSWTPLFFHAHLTGTALICLLMIVVLVGFLITFSYETRLKAVCFFLTPYFLWLLLAAYLNFYIWQYN